MIGALRERVRGLMERDRIPGVALALVRDGELLHAEGLGTLDATGDSPVEASSLFGVASITKPVVATGVMQQVEAGRLALDAPLAPPLVPLPLRGPCGEPVTLRHLLSHSAGLPVGNVPAAPAATTLRAQVEAAADRFEAPPGARVLYANWGYDVAGFVLGEAVGRPWHEQLRDALLVPLGMERSAIGTAPEVAGHFASALDGGLHRTDAPEGRIEPPTASGSLVSSALELARFLLLHLGGGSLEGVRLLAPASVAEMHRVQAPAGPGGGVGLGFRVARRRGRTLLLHGGDGAGTTHAVAALPEAGAGVVLLANRSHAQAFRSETLDAALAALLEEPPVRPVAVSTPAALEGRYRSTFWEMEADVVARGSDLAFVLGGGLVASGERAETRLVPTGVGSFQGEGGFLAGFEVHAEVAGEAPRLYGGLYPFTFERIGDAGGEREGPRGPDADAELDGRWAGSCASPTGPVPVALTVEAPDRVRATALAARDVVVEGGRAEAGRVEGAFDTEAPGLGTFRITLRLRAEGGALRGSVWARGGLGEFEMSAHLEREGEPG